MMDFITVPVTFGIGALAFYKVLELYARRKERLMIIEKLSLLDGETSDELNFSKLLSNGKNDKGQYLTLRFGSLAIGLGLGLMIGYFLGLAVFPTLPLESDFEVYSRFRNSIELIYGASTLLFGGLGMIVGFLVEHKMRKDAK